MAGVLEDRWRKERRMRNKARRDISWGRCGTVGLHMVRGGIKARGGINPVGGVKPGEDSPFE